MNDTHAGQKALVIEDERDIAELIKLHLSDICEEVAVAGDGHEGLRLALMRTWDLIVLDVRLPGIDGLEICRRVRANGNYTPILMLTAKTTELDKVLGLELGADDYLTKPFSVLELMARAKAIFRRVDALSSKAVLPANNSIDYGELVIDVDNREVLVRGESVGLTAKEFDLLVHFAQHPGRVYRRSQLLDLVWGYGHAGYEHTVNSHINRLRAKIELDPANPSFIKTVWGVGYKFDHSVAHA